MLSFAPPPYNLKDVLEIVDNIDFKNPDDIHTVSHVYEGLLQKLGNENKLAGEFHTPRPSDPLYCTGGESHS